MCCTDQFPAPFALCAAVCAVRGWGGVCTRQSPLKRTLRRLWTMCERARRILLRRWETEPLGMRVSLPTMSRFGGFRPLFTRSIKAQDKRPQSQAPAARPQSPAVRGFQRFQDRSRFARLNRKTAVKGEQDTPLVPITADFSRWTFRRRLRNLLFSTARKSDFQVRAIFGADRAYFEPL